MSRFLLPVNGSGTAAGTWVNTGGSRPGILTDASDATYTKKSSTSTRDALFMPLTDVSIPANEVFHAIRWTCRMNRPSGGSVSVALTDTNAVLYTGNNGGAKSYNGPWLTKHGATNNLDWDAAALNAAQIIFGDKVTSAASASTLYEAGAEVDTASVPAAATVSAPSGTITDTATPQVAWTHNDNTVGTVTNRASSGTTRTLTIGAHSMLVGNDVTVAISNASYDGTFKITAVGGTTISYVAGSSLTEGTTAASGTATIGDGADQAAYEVRIFTAAQYGAGGFDPATSAATWESGQVTSNAATLTPGTLATATYRAYVRTAKEVNGSLVWGAFAFSGFTVSVTPPTVTLSASFDSANNRVQLVVAGTGNILSAQDANLETASDTGTWVANANCTVSQSTTFADSGTGSLRLSSTAAGTMSARTASGLAADPVLPNTAYSARARVRAGSAARTCTIAIQWYDATGAALTTSTGTGVADATGSWTTITVTATSPAGAAFASVLVTVASTAAGAELHYVDSISLHPGSTPAYSPGGQTYSLVLTRTPTGGTAEPVRPPLALDVAQKATLYDYEALRGIQSTWSATLVGTSPLGTVSSGAATSNATPTNDGTWWVKAVADPTLNRGSVRIVGDPEESHDEDQGVFRLQGRPDVIVVAGQSYGDDPSYDLYTSTAAEWEAINALLVHQGTLLIQEPYTDSAGVGLQKYVRLTGERRWTRKGVVAAPRRDIKVTGVEVGSGL